MELVHALQPRVDSDTLEHHDILAPLRFVVQLTLQAR